MASFITRSCLNKCSARVPFANKRAFSATVRSNAEIKKLGVIGAGQMVRKQLLLLPTSKLTAIRVWELLLLQL